MKPTELDEQIRPLLEGLTRDLAVWLDLTSRFRADLFCGLFMAGANEGMTLRPATLSMIGERGLEIDFDIYAAD